MSQELDALLDRVENAALRADLRRQIDLVRAKRSFGLVFESHLPERVRLSSHPVRRASSVAFRAGDDKRTWTVEVVRDGKATIVIDDEMQIVPVADVVVVAEFGEPIYPGLRHAGSVHRGGEKPAHVVINGENHHALEALRFTHAGQVDCIYIDPPYNTGARDWKYDNDYVDGDDAYRHSKWLAFMERRLLLAKELLNPDDSVLIVTIDEKEYLRLGMLLEQTFPEVRVQKVTIVINAPGQARKRELARVEEYAFFLFFGSAEPTSVTDDLLNDRPSTSPERVRWESLLRSGTNSRRADRPALFFPVFVAADGKRIVAVGDSKPLGAHREDWNQPPDTYAVWPLKSDGSEGNWRASPEYLRSLCEKGFVRLGEYRADEGRGTIWYLGKAALKKIETGEIEVVGRDEQGAVQVRPAAGAGSRTTTAKTVWNRPAHHAGWHGSALVRALLPGRNFPFPKSLYAVEDAVRLAVGGKPQAVVLDFFGGSGTTAHAVARLNRQDGGSRQSIVVTNNEVSADEAAALREQGHAPGDPEWEALGIFEHITRPRITAAVTGHTPDGEPIKGDYKFTDEFPMSEGFEENVEFFDLTYQDAERVELDLAFEAIAPLLWLRAGGKGPIVTETRDTVGRRVPYEFGETYAVLFNPDRWRSFVDKLTDEVRVVFIVTDSTTTFSSVAAELPGDVDAVRLYRNYLSTFEINRGLGA